MNIYLTQIDSRHLHEVSWRDVVTWRIKIRIFIAAALMLPDPTVEAQAYALVTTDHILKLVFETVSDIVLMWLKGQDERMETGILLLE